MMKNLLKILFAPLLWLFHSCSPLGNPVDPEKSDSHYYNNSKSEIRYSPMGNWFELGNTGMHADVESFEVFNRWLGRDKDQLFYEAYAVTNLPIDLATFRVKDEDYMAHIGFDSNFVYAFDKVYEGDAYRGRATIIDGADPKTYVQTDIDWANDGKLHFFRNHKIEADFDSFQPLNDYFAKDSSRAYVRNDNCFESFGADVASLELLGESSHTIDKKNVYWLPFFTENASNPIALPYADKAEVEILNPYFLRVADTIYYDGQARPDIDNQSFEIIDHSYAKDATHVYYKDNIVENADVATFRRLEGSYKYIDKNGTYHEGRLEEK
ncbi:hypothetical protein FGM00_02920 [Aggregatimonas sangjinii]|uniref:DKNYY family protein n=1 Tax=Aggregatimonas sangjinii TaxID=2583587 RepID=A0A5B7SKV6_9FLAO|nr:DKNYY domain-containing protein [Aggregatimonas sangjinii]QCW99116.1 hypothetical protein FGM00_02920 [Aggregatimonas sangjinii]